MKHVCGSDVVFHVLAPSQVLLKLVIGHTSLLFVYFVDRECVLWCSQVFSWSRAITNWSK